MLNIKLLEKLTSIPSPSGYTFQLTTYLEEYLKHLGYTPFKNKKGNSRYFRLRSHLLFPLYMQLVHKIFSRCVYYNNFFVSVNFFLQVFSLYLILYIYLSVLNNTHDRSVSPRNTCFPAVRVSALSASSQSRCLYRKFFSEPPHQRSDLFWSNLLPFGSHAY